MNKPKIYPYISCKTCSDKKLVKSTSNIDLTVYGMIGDQSGVFGSGFWICICPHCASKEANVIVYNPSDLDTLNIYNKETDRVDNYPLTWAEATLAMERGAICDGEKHRKHRIIDDHIECYLGHEWRNLKDHNVIFKYPDMMDDKWRIVELTDCELIICNQTHPNSIYPPRYLMRCEKHWESMISHFKEEKNQLQARCIAAFTAQLKENSQNRDKIDQQLKKNKQISLEEGKFYTVLDDEPTYKIQGNCLKWYYKEWEKSSYSIEEFLQLRNLRETSDPEEVSFEEAVEGMREGKFYQDTQANHIVTLGDDDVFLGWIEETQEWAELKITLIDFDLKYVEVDDPEKEEEQSTPIPFNGLGMWLTETAVKPCLLSQIGFIGVENSHQRDAWEKAMETFWRLKSHPLVVRPSKDKSVEYYQLYPDSTMNITIHRRSGEWHIMALISPAFKNKDDAEQAIADIGEDKLKQMFLTFQGIYNE